MFQQKMRFSIKSVRKYVTTIKFKLYLVFGWKLMKKMEWTAFEKNYMMPKKKNNNFVIFTFDFPNSGSQCSWKPHELQSSPLSLPFSFLHTRRTSTYEAEAARPPSKLSRLMPRSPPPPELPRRQHTIGPNGRKSTEN